MTAVLNDSGYQPTCDAPTAPTRFGGNLVDRRHAISPAVEPHESQKFAPVLRDDQLSTLQGVLVSLARMEAQFITVQIRERFDGTD